MACIRNLAVLHSKLHALDEKVKIKEKNWIDVERFRIQNHLPGISLFVSINGKTVYRSCHGLADMENGTKMKDCTAVRVASISKVFTALMIAEQVENEKIKFSEKIQEYIDYPEKCSDILISDLLSHKSGTRHYSKKLKQKDLTPEEKADQKQELHSCNRFENAHETLKTFKNDPLIVPNGEFLYTTYGYSILQDVLEHVTEKSFEKLLKQFCSKIGLEDTHVDKPEEIIKNRARGYIYNDFKVGLKNAPPVDLSNKYGGGGIISTGPDLIKFGNAVLYSFTHVDGVISPKTLSFMRNGGDEEYAENLKNYGYGLKNMASLNKPWLENSLDGFGHGGNAIDASSLLRIHPFYEDKSLKTFRNERPEGMVIVLLTNRQDINFNGLADTIANNYLS